MKSMGATQDEYYRGVHMVPYDLVKELFLALAGVGLLALLAAVILSSPDVAPVTIANWAQSDPVDFVTTATNELAGSSTSAAYGNPYNTVGPGQSWGPIAPQKWFGTRIPVDSTNAFVIQPLQRASFSNTDLGTALTTWQGASSDQQTQWLDVYLKALPNATVTDGKVTVANGDYGPLPVMMSNLLGVAQAGGLDGLLVINGRFYQTDYTQPLLFIGDGSYLAGLAAAVHDVVPGAAFHQLDGFPRSQLIERRPGDHHPHDAAYRRAGAGASDPRSSRHPAMDSDPSPHLAPVLRPAQGNR